MAIRTERAAGAPPMATLKKAEHSLPVTVFGAGYVGLVSAACLAGLDHRVVCVDTDSLRVARLARGEVPIHEPGLQELMAHDASAGRLRFTASAHEAVAHGRVQIIAVRKPQYRTVFVNQ